VCIFCQIAANRAPKSVVLENERFVAFDDIAPVAPVHVLIIPKRHIVSFDEVDAETMREMTGFIQEVARKVGVDKSGYRLVTNVGRNGGQEVLHMHWHLLGGGKIRWGS